MNQLCCSQDICGRPERSPCCKGEYIMVPSSIMRKFVYKSGRTPSAGTVKYYAQIRLQIWQNSVCTGQGNLPLIIQ